MNKNESDAISYKIILIGNSSVGKTSIINRFLYNSFSENIYSTIGVNIINKALTLQNGQNIILNVHDTAGQEKYRSLSKSFFRNVDAVLFVYAINDLESFRNIKDWIQLFMENHNGKKDIPHYLIENKNDLDRGVEEYLIDEFLNENKLFKFKSISAKIDEGNSINELFQEIGEILNKDYKKTGKNQRKLVITKHEVKKNKKGCICSMKTNYA